MEVTNMYSAMNSISKEAYEQFSANQSVNAVTPESPTPIKETVKYLHETCICNRELAIGLEAELYGKRAEPDVGKAPAGENLRDELGYILKVCEDTQKSLNELRLNLTGEWSKNEA